jgi:hypothetical protein
MPECTYPLRQRGALVKALVRGAGSKRPVHVGPFSAYLDTGASNTMLDDSLTRSLNIEPAREVVLSVLGRTDASFHDAYAVEVALVLADGETSPWVRVEAMAGAVYPTGAVAALGRDFLAHFVLTYDGPARRASLRW